MENQTQHAAATQSPPQQQVGAPAATTAGAPAQHRQPDQSIMEYAQQPPPSQPPVNPALPTPPQYAPPQQPSHPSDDAVTLHEAACRKVGEAINEATVALAEGILRAKRLKMPDQPVLPPLLNILERHRHDGFPYVILREVFGGGRKLDEALKKLHDTGRIREEGERKNRVVYLIK